MLQEYAARSFLKADWQKRCRFLPLAADDDLPILDKDEIAWLATLPDVESRLVLTERDGTATRYHLESGPFHARRLARLPARDWTLLVNDLEKHLPDFRPYLAMADFLPDWRIDDLMVSVAAPGGSVGPHVDNYDVFLVQGSGIRNWQVGSAADTEPDETSESLSLIKPFEVAHRFRCSSRDVLYLPPGRPHWGIAEDLCTTFSIGMRAPSRTELRLSAERLLDKDFQGGSGDDQDFYTDPDLGLDEALPGMIHPRTIARLREQTLVDDMPNDDVLATVLGCTVTDPKAWLCPEGIEGRDAKQLLASTESLPVHGMARIAWYESADNLLVFVNGQVVHLQSGLRNVIADLCQRRRLDPVLAGKLTGDDSEDSLLRWLLAAGLFDAHESRG